MRVLMNCLSSVSGGAVAYLRYLTPLLAERFSGSSRHSLQLVAHHDQAELLSGVDPTQVSWVYGTRPTGFGRIVWERRHLPELVRQHRSDVLFTPYQVDTPVPGVLRVLMLRNMEPFLFSGYRYSARSRLRNRLLRYASQSCLRSADRVIAVSRFASETLSECLGVNPVRIHTVYHGSPDLRAKGDADIIDRERLRQIGVEGTFILSCGSLLPYRRTEDVVAAYTQCVADLSEDTTLVIAGSGSDHRYGRVIERVIAASPVRDRITCLGHVPWEVMAALYRRCQLCVIATEIEACPNIALEAMAAGCAIVASDRKPLPEMFRDSALYYPARDVESLAQTIVACANDRALRECVSNATLGRSSDFSWSICANQTYSALTEW